MKIAITARHFDLTPALKEYAQEKIRKLEKHFEVIIEGEVILSRESGFDVAEGKIHLRHNVFVAKGRSNDMYLAVSEMVDKLVKQLRRQEGKWQSKKRAARIKK
jgi:ribosomal subunit interface protein